MTPKTKTTPPGPEPAKALSPAELAEQLMNLADQAFEGDDNNAMKRAETALAVAKANVAYNGEKQLRILRAKSIEEAETILAENRADLNLVILCRKRSGWQPLREKGATDAQLRAFLGKRGNGWPEYHGTDKVPSAEVGYNENAKVWVDPDKGVADKDCVSGQKLIDAVRRVMGIKKPAAPGPAVSKKKPGPPQKPSPKPTPSKKPAAKPKAPPAPAKTPAPDDDDGKGEDIETTARQKMEIAARGSSTRKLEEFVTELKLRQTPNADGMDACRREVVEAELAKRSRGDKPKPAPGPRKLTWGQWAATLWGISDGQKLSADVPQRKVLTERERFFLTQFEIGKRPSEARDAWIKQAGASMAAAINEAAGIIRPVGAATNRGEGQKPGVLPSVAALSKPQTPMPMPMPTPEDESGDTAAAAKKAFETARAGGASFGKTLDAGVRKILAEKAPAAAADNSHADAKCRVCGCTEEDCRECIEATGQPCRWVDDPIIKGRLCSACKPDQYGFRAAGTTASGIASASGVIIGAGKVDGQDLYQLHLSEGMVVWIRKKGVRFSEDTLADTKTGHAAGEALLDDPNVDGRGVFVSGVTELIVAGGAKGDKTKIEIHVARGADGMYRSGHLLEFPQLGAAAWEHLEPVKISAQAVVSEAYAIKTRAEILVNVIKAAPGAGPSGGGGWSAEQRRVYNEALRTLDRFIRTHPSCKERKPAKAGAA